MIRYMLDTNVCIGVINNTPPALRQQLMRLSPMEIAISHIVYYELAFGVRNSAHREKNQANLDHFLKYVQVLDWGDEQSLAAAQIRCELLRRGQPIGSYDLLIAAHALSLNLILVTHNTREYARVDGLRIEDWFISLS
ncbi:MAG: type II toxin-antitoxin system VapC family toxin [Caldilineaceae bacterium]|nr:type II toxin-antitoxin system VapC family toxin [Caldilineaceae bacterium]